MSIMSVSAFVTASLVLVGLALALLVLSIAAVAVPYFVDNRRARVARQEPFFRYYRHQIALG